MATAKETFTVTDHVLVSEHLLLNEKECEEILQRYNIAKKQLPLIKSKDPALQHLQAKPGDIIKIIRKSLTQGTSTFYRLIE